MSVELRKLQAHWERVRQGLFETIDKFGEDELKYVPFEGSHTVGSIMLTDSSTRSITVGSSLWYRGCWAGKAWRFNERSFLHGGN